MSEKLWLNEVIDKFEIKFEYNKLNIINAPAGSGKTTFVFNDFLNSTYKYIDKFNNTKRTYLMNLNKIIYVCDTRMLKDSILFKESNKDKVKILKENSIKESMKNGSLKRLLENNNQYGKILVITYSQLGYLLQDKNCKHIILKYFNCILFDEIHNLVRYLKKYDKENDRKYGIVIDNTPLMLREKELMVIGLTATPEMSMRYFLDKSNIKYRIILYGHHLRYIRKYEAKQTVYTNYVLNKIKEIINISSILSGKKMMIYTNTISISEKYKKLLNKYGIKAEWLCSINNKKEMITVDDYGNKIKEKIPRMNNYQINLRAKLLNDGILPDDLDVIIVNGGYETGWDLYDKRVQVVMIDTTDQTIQIQARNRCRHDIDKLILKAITDEEGTTYEKDQFGVPQIMMIPRRGGTYTPVVNNINLVRLLNEKYIGYKLNKQIKDEIVERYGVKKYFDKKDINFKNMKADFDEAGFVVKTYKGKNGGTYIFKKCEEIKKDSKREVSKIENKNSNINLVCNWLEEEWDKVIIPVNEVRDILDIGRKSWDNIMKDNEFNTFLKDNRIKMNVVKGRGRTLYFKKY